MGKSDFKVRSRSFAVSRQKQWFFNITFITKVDEEKTIFFQHLRLSHHEFFQLLLTKTVKNFLQLEANVFVSFIFVHLYSSKDTSNSQLKLCLESLTLWRYNVLVEVFKAFQLEIFSRELYFQLRYLSFSSYFLEDFSFVPYNRFQLFFEFSKNKVLWLSQ